MDTQGLVTLDQLLGTDTLDSLSLTSEEHGDTEVAAAEDKAEPEKTSPEVEANVPAIVTFGSRDVRFGDPDLVVTGSMLSPQNRPDDKMSQDVSPASSSDTVRIPWHPGGIQCPVPKCPASGQWFSKLYNYVRHYKEKHEEFSKYFECPIEAGHFRCKRRPDMRRHLTKAHHTLAPGTVEGLMRNIPHSMRVNRGYVNPVGYVLPPEMVNRQQRTQNGPGRQDVPQIQDPVSSTQALDVADFRTTPGRSFASSTVACMTRRGLLEH